MSIAHDPSPLPQRRMRLRAWQGILITLALAINVAVIAGVAWVATHEQRAIDQFRVWKFEPSSQLQKYADRSTMTDEGRFLFFASLPEIAGEGDFDEICSSRLEDVGILGCYLTGEKTIFLYDVTDDRLDGIEEVVAAHEMLHAAWDRMSDDERAELEPMLEAAAATKKDDPAFVETLAFYARTEPGERLNELHSIIGTEFGELDPELEAHYSLYFADRVAVTAMHDASNAVFIKQAEAVAALAAQLTALAASIDADYASYNAGFDQLNSDIGSFNSRAEGGAFSSQSQFAAARDDLLQRQSDLDAFFAAIDVRVAEHNALVMQLDDLNAQGDELNQSINIEPRSDTGL